MAEQPTDPTWGTLPAGEDPLEGTPYSVVGHIATGGMGEVYLADHRFGKARFVVKLLHAQMVSDSRLVDRMRVEAQALSVLHHPSIVNVYDSGTTPSGRPYLVMERLRGSTLADELRQRGPLPVAEALEWVQALLSGLQAAHDIGLVHRDVKLSNLFLHETAGQQRTLKILDFGIAKVLAGASDRAPQPLHHPTEVGVIIGTPAYISPEAILGQPVDHRADVYAAGIVLYILLCGRGPWDQKRRELEVLASRVREVPKPPSAYASQPVPPEVDALVMKALARDPDERFRTAREFALAVEHAVANLRQAPAQSGPIAVKPVAVASSAQLGPTPCGEDEETLLPGQTRPELALTEGLLDASAFGRTELLDDRPLDRRFQDARSTLTAIRALPERAARSASARWWSGVKAALASPALRLAFAALVFGSLGWWILNVSWR